MGDQVVVADEVVVQQVAIDGSDETMEDVGVVPADDAKKPISAELQHDGNANGNADGAVGAAAAPFELQPAVEETPGNLRHFVFLPRRVFMTMFVGETCSLVGWGWIGLI